MTFYHGVGYSDIFQDSKPPLEEILEGINPKSVILAMSIVNCELKDEDTFNDTQRRLTNLFFNQFPPISASYIFSKLKEIEQRTAGQFRLWSKRYALELMKRVFLNYQEIESRRDETLQIFKAYLWIVEELNNTDSIRFTETTNQLTREDDFIFEKLVWPFVIQQFRTNERINILAHFYRLLAFIKFSLSDAIFRNAWKLFLQKNGFKSLKQYLNVIYEIGKISRHTSNDGTLKFFVRLDGSKASWDVKKLVFDRELFVTNKNKQVEYLGFREQPLFETSEGLLIALDLDYFAHKILSWPFFDLYEQGELNKISHFSTFTKFKSHISKEVSETIVFRSILKELFGKKYYKLAFDPPGDGSPDCYIRFGSKIFLIEFKDYLFSGKTIESYSFDLIKESIDQRFIKNRSGKKKGITQLMAQITRMNTKPFNFDQDIPDKILVYPIIVHTNFIFQMPGINHYLKSEFHKILKQSDLRKGVQVKELTLIDFNTLFDCLWLKRFSFNKLAKMIEDYHHLLSRRELEFLNNLTPENFAKSRASFEEVFRNHFEPGLKSITNQEKIDLFKKSIGITEEMLNTF